MLSQIQHGQECIRIRLIALGLHCRSQQRLRQYDVGERTEIEELRICVEQLSQQRLDAVEVMLWLRIEPFEFNVEHIYVLCKVSEHCPSVVRLMHTSSLLLSSSLLSSESLSSSRVGSSSLRFAIVEQMASKS